MNKVDKLLISYPLKCLDIRNKRRKSMDKIKELENKIAEISKKLEKLKSKQTNDWTPEQNEKYWYIDSFSVIISSKWYDDSEDNFRKDYLKIFKTEAEAKEYLDYIKARKEYSYEFTQEEWENVDICKYSITYDYCIDVLGVARIFNIKNIGVSYFKTKQDGLDFIEKYEKQIRKYELGIEVKCNMKIKDNVDLKELEKYGFKEGKDTCNVSYDAYGKIFELEYSEEIDDILLDIVEIDKKTKKIYLKETSKKAIRCFTYEDEEKLKNYIDDLIKANLVEMEE